MLSQDMHNVAEHGVRDLNGTGASYCTFANSNLASTMDRALVLRLLIPHLHEALLRTWRPYQAEGNKRATQSVERLTEREREVLRWLAQDKSNPVIAQILDRSEFTIRNQVSSILQKLSVANRIDAMLMVNLVGQSLDIGTRQERQLSWQQ